MKGLLLQLSENSVGERFSRRAMVFARGMLEVNRARDVCVHRKGR